MQGKEKILDKEGNVIRSSRNLRGIRDYVAMRRRYGVRHIAGIHLYAMSDLTGEMLITFHDGVNYKTTFASFAVLIDWVSRWRNVYGSPLFVNGESKGKVDSRNPALLRL